MEPNNKLKWNDLTYKERLGYIFASACFALGWLITFIAFFVEPVGDVSNSVLYILGQALLFSGAIVGIGQYFNMEVQNYKSEIRRYLDTREKELEDKE